MQTKFCPDCRQELISQDHFNRNRSRPDGFAAYCKPCNSKRRKSIRDARTPEKVMRDNEKFARWAASNSRNHYWASYYAANRAAQLEKSRAWRQANPEKMAALQKAYREKFGICLNEKKNELRRADPGIQRRYYLERKQQILARCKKWKAENREKVARYRGARRASLLERTPAWLTDSDWRKIDALYAEAAERTSRTGVIHHVDHVIPLQGPLVSGLHVPGNLQVLTGEENLRKGNRWSIQ